MMGIQQKQGEPWDKFVNLSSHISEDHVLKLLDWILAPGSIREDVVGTYGKKGIGDETVIPVRFLKRVSGPDQI